MRNRYYDPSTGQFTQEDPIGLAGGLNLYGFAAGDPVSYSDPFGLCPNPLAQGLGSLQCAIQDIIGAVKAGPGILADAIRTSPHVDFVVGLAMVPFTVAGGGEEAAGEITQWGWRGTAKYRAAIKQIGTEAKEALTHLDVLGKVPTQAEAVGLIEKAGGVVNRIDEAHLPGGVSTHTFPHINYTTRAGTKATVRITEVVQP